MALALLACHCVDRPTIARAAPPAASATANTPAPTSAAPAMRAEGGSILRQVSGLQGKEDPQRRPLEPLVTPQSHVQSFNPTGSLAPPPPTGHAQTGLPSTGPSASMSVDDDGWQDYLPEGVLPFGGSRTPECDRASAWGEPLVGTSWLNRPLGASIFLGVLDGSPLIGDYLIQGSGFFGGGRLSWDYDYYWGLETRLGLGFLKLNNPRSAVAPDSTNVLNWDISLLYYPWGDTRWRPYAIAGLGLASFRYIDENYNDEAHGSLSLPFGLGVKYQLNTWLVARVEVLDNWTMSGGTLDTMHNVSGTAGLEFRFGGRRRSYWPWHPGSYVY